MIDCLPTRQRTSGPVRLACIVLALCPFVPVCVAAPTGIQYTQAPAPIERRPPAPHSGKAGDPSQNHQAQRNGLPRGEHLAEWMNQHRDLTPQQQQQALDREPGFRELPQPTQQRMRDRLAQLDAMTPDQRQRLLARNEALERLTPDQRSEFRSAMQQLGALPLEQRRPVAQTFHALRELPPEQRISAFSTGRYGPPLSDTQRAVLFNLLRVEPLMPPPVTTALPR